MKRYRPTNTKFEMRTLALAHRRYGRMQAPKYPTVSQSESNLSARHKVGVSETKRDARRLGHECWQELESNNGSVGVSMLGSSMLQCTTTSS